jgi:hypothetical protein
MSAGAHRQLEQVIGHPVLERRHASELESSCPARTEADNHSEAYTAGELSPPAYAASLQLPSAKCDQVGCECGRLAQDNTDHFETWPPHREFEAYLAHSGVPTLQFAAPEQLAGDRPYHMSGAGC